MADPAEAGASVVIGANPISDEDFNEETMEEAGIAEFFLSLPLR